MNERKPIKVKNATPICANILSKLSVDIAIYTLSRWLYYTFFAPILVLTLPFWTIVLSNLVFLDFSHNILHIPGFTSLFLFACYNKEAMFVVIERIFQILVQ